MALITCKDCNKEFSTDAKRCPHCGSKKPGTIGCLPLGILIVIGIFGVSILLGKLDPELNKPTPKLDYTKPIYTAYSAIICPQALLYDYHEEHGPQALFDLFTAIFHREEKAKAMGCEIWQKGIPVYDAHRMDKPLDYYVSISRDPGGMATMFTMEADLMNAPDTQPSPPDKSSKPEAAPVAAAPSADATPVTPTASERQVRDIQIVKGSCAEQSHIAEGHIGEDLTKRQSRFYCDSAAITFFNDNPNHILIQFANTAALHSLPIGFAGLMQENGEILDVQNVYLEGGKPTHVTEGVCKFFFKNKHMSAILCAAKIDEDGRRTVPNILFEASPGQ